MKEQRGDKVIYLTPGEGEIASIGMNETYAWYRFRVFTRDRQITPRPI